MSLSVKRCITACKADLGIENTQMIQTKSLYAAFIEKSMRKLAMRFR